MQLFIVGRIDFCRGVSDRDEAGSLALAVSRTYGALEFFVIQRIDLKHLKKILWRDVFHAVSYRYEPAYWFSENVFYQEGCVVK